MTTAFTNVLYKIHT